MSEELILEKVGIAERTLVFSLKVIRFHKKLAHDEVGRILGKQLLRSGTSIGANVHEAQGAQTKADFIAKMSIAQKEALETAYWLRLIKEAQLVLPDDIIDLFDETSQLLKILSKILITSKRNSSQSIFHF